MSNIQIGKSVQWSGSASQDGMLEFEFSYTAFWPDHKPGDGRDKDGENTPSFGRIKLYYVQGDNAARIAALVAAAWSVEFGTNPSLDGNGKVTFNVSSATQMRARTDALTTMPVIGSTASENLGNGISAKNVI